MVSLDTIAASKVDLQKCIFIYLWKCQNKLFIFIYIYYSWIIFKLWHIFYLNYIFTFILFNCWCIPSFVFVFLQLVLQTNTETFLPLPRHSNWDSKPCWINQLSGSLKFIYLIIFMNAWLHTNVQWWWAVFLINIHITQLLNTNSKGEQHHTTVLYSLFQEHIRWRETQQPTFIKWMVAICEGFYDCCCLFLVTCGCLLYKDHQLRVRVYTSFLWHYITE